MITQSKVLELLEYKDGILYRKKRTSNRIKVGDAAGYETVHGYMRVCVEGTGYFVHRLVWLMFYGDPPEFIDHIDCNKKNNRIENLRAADKSTNNMNLEWNKRNTSGYKGVSFDKDSGKWKAQIKFNHKKYSIGRFSTPELAHAAYCKKALELFGEFANIGRKPEVK